MAKMSFYHLSEICPNVVEDPAAATHSGLHYWDIHCFADIVTLIPQWSGWQKWVSYYKNKYIHYS